MLAKQVLYHLGHSASPNHKVELNNYLLNEVERKKMKNEIL
jgi:hypothetical protein